MNVIDMPARRGFILPDDPYERHLGFGVRR